MSNVIQFKKKILTKGELYLIDKRIDEIENIMSLCTDLDYDILDNLEKELDNICKYLESFL